jgi:cytohesin
MFASYYNALDSVKVLIENGAATDIFSKDASALIMAAEKGNTETVKYLIEHDANIDGTAQNGETAFLAACKFGKTDTARYLAESGADISRKTANGNNALICAAQKNNPETLRFLIEKGLSVNEANR